MKHKSMILAAAAAVLAACSGVKTETQGIISVLPVSGDIESWEPVGEPELFVDEDLFILINGGAEIYHEYGFRQVVFQELKSTGGKSVNIEVFEMEDPSSAYGIYTFKTGEKGKEMNIGGGLILEEYYLNFWKDNKLITLTGFDSEKETIDGLLAVAGAIENKIKKSAPKPDLYGMLPGDDLNTEAVKYLQGNLALYNNYEFDTADIFRISECIMGKYTGHRLFIFGYDEEVDVEGIFSRISGALKVNRNFTDFENVSENTFKLTDRNGELLVIRQYGKYILAFLGSSVDKAESVFDAVMQ
ncbi:DUF6599 family protein [candidate division KSB1 bacterium]